MTSPSEIRLPWPERRLWPNSKVGWQALHRAKKEAKQAAWGIFHSLPLKPEIEQYQHWEVIFLSPHAHHFDEDNALAACKAYIDGIAYAVGGDDGFWSYKTKRKMWEYKGVIFRPITPEPVKADDPIRKSKLIYGDMRDEFLQDITFLEIPLIDSEGLEDFISKWDLQTFIYTYNWGGSLDSFIENHQWLAIYKGDVIAAV